MPIRVPPAEKVIRDQRLTLIRVIGTLQDRLVDGDQGLKSKVKAAMLDKGAKFAESELVIAALRAGTPRPTIDARRLYKLVDPGALKLADFLSCISVVRERLKQFLSLDQIEKLSREGPEPSPALVTEFKIGLEIDPDALAGALSSAIAQTVPIKLD